MHDQIVIRYLYNSGFTIEYGNDFIVIDYVEGPLTLPVDREILFIVTHAHSDHYNPAIFSLPGAERARYVLSTDIEAPEAIEASQASGTILRLASTREETAVRKIVYDPKRTRRIAPMDAFHWGDVAFQAFGSTDQGVSLLFTIHGVSFFHAGDLNAWAWPNTSKAEQTREESDYRRWLDRISAYPIDIGFGVVDPRLGENAMIGGALFLEMLKPQIFIPMHFREGTDAPIHFRKIYQPRTDSVIKVLTEPGERVIVQG